MARGMVAWSYGLAEKEPNPCNASLGIEAYRIMREEEKNTGEDVVLLAQWEVAVALREVIGFFPVHVVKKHRRGEYLDSGEVMAQAANIFRDYGITSVIPVANPFLHLFACRRLIREFGFAPIKQKVRWIGFYKDSLQWWTRGPIKCFAYAVMQKLWGRSGR